MSTAEAATRALEFLSGPEKWIKDDFAGPFYRPDRVCLGNALLLAKCGSLTAWIQGEPEYEAAWEIITAQFPDRVAAWRSALRGVPAFNDHPDTTFDEVRMVLEKMAAG